MEARHASRVSCILLSLIVVLLVGANSAFAYNLQSYGYYSRSIAINTSSKVYSSAWSTPITNAIGSWNKAGVGASITQNGAAANYMQTGSYGNLFIGSYDLLDTNSTGKHRTTRFRIRLNTDYNDQGSTFQRSTVCHELGHVLGLDHESAKSVIMNSLRNRFVIYAPQLDDKNGVTDSWD